jgi:hypothetical protein
MKRMPHRIANRMLAVSRHFGVGAVSLEENDLIARARKETGLREFGDESFLEPMRRVLHGLQHESKTNPLGDFFARANIVRLLKNRLLANDLFVRHPEILERELAPPVTVVGLARSGTTRTHRLLACDPQFVHLKTWEAILPAPVPGSFTEKVDPRRTEIEYGLKIVDYLMPHMAAVHPMGTDEVEEEAGLIQHGFETSLFGAMNTLPSYWEWYIERPCDASYRYMVKLMKLIGWFRGDDPKKPWILKTPEHMVNFAPLLRCFPDAKIVSTHRDPLSVLSSLMSMAWMALVRDYDELDAGRIGAQWKSFQDTSIRNYLAVRDGDMVAEGQILDLLYEDLNTDWEPQVEKLYAHFNLELTDEARGNMRKWMKENRQGKHGAHRHSLEQFGFDPAELEVEYADYRARFGIPFAKRPS